MKKLLLVFALSFMFTGCEQTQYTTHETRMVYVTPTGKCYHYRSSCAGKNAYQIKFSEAEIYYNPCKKCVK